MTAGGPINQSGSVTAGHIAVWTADGIIQDGGTVAPTPAPAGNLSQSGSVTAGHIAVWTGPGVLQDGGTTYPNGDYPGIPIAQTGSITPGHLAVWTTDGVVQDGGTAGIFVDLTLIDDVIGSSSEGTIATTVVAIGGQSISLGGPFITGGTLDFIGAFPSTINVTGSTDVTLPTSGTLGTMSNFVAVTNAGTATIAQGSTLNATAGTMSDWVAITNSGTTTVTNGTTLNIVSVGAVTAGAGLTTTPGGTGGTITNAGTLYDVLPIVAQTGTTYTIANANQGTWTIFNNGSNVAVTLPQGGASSLFLNGWSAFYENAGANLLTTITPTTSTILGTSAIYLQPGQSAEIVSDGTNYQALIGSPLYVLANNALSTRLPGVPTAALGGNARGQQAIDIQPYYSIGAAGTNVASGNQAIVIGVVSKATGQFSTAIGFQAFATSSSALAVGQITQASGVQAVAVGYDVTVTGTNAVAFGCVGTSQGTNSVNVGSNNNADQANSITIGNNNLVAGGTGGIAVGTSITIDGSYSVGLGFGVADRLNSGVLIHSAAANVGSSNGQSQTEEYVFINSTSAAASVRLTTDGSASIAFNVASLANNSAMQFTCDIILRDTNSGAALTYSQATSLITRGTSAATTAMSSGNPSMTAGPATTSPPTLQAAPSITADTTNGGFNISYQPPVANTDTWYAVGRLRCIYVG
jgi:trimeric autotransporter adhesin